MDTITDRTSGTKPSHTPGPWTNDHYPDDDQIVISAKSRIGYIPVAEMRCGYEGHIETEQHANARLIAAAPAMLAQLLAVRALIAEGAMTGFNPLDGDWAERLFKSQGQTTDAINKATRG